MPITASKEFLHQALHFMFRACIISLCLIFYAAGFYWALRVAFPLVAPTSLAPSMIGVILIIVAIFMVKKIEIKYRAMMLLSSVLFTISSPIPPYLPLFHNILSLVTMLTFLFFFLFIALKQGAIYAIAASFLNGSLVTLLTLGAFIVAGHRDFTGRETIGVTLFLSATLLIICSLFFKESLKGKQASVQ